MSKSTNKREKFTIFYKIFLLTLLVAYFLSMIVFAYPLYEPSGLTRYYFFIFFLTLICGVLVYFILLIGRKAGQEKELKDHYLEYYMTIKSKIFASMLSKKNKKSSTNDVLSMILEAQNSNKNIIEFIPDPEEFAQEVVDAYGKSMYSFSDVLDGLLWVLFFLLSAHIFPWSIEYFFSSGIIEVRDFYQYTISFSTILIAISTFSIPIRNRYMHHSKYWKNIVKIGLIISMCFISIIFGLQILYNISGIGFNIVLHQIQLIPSFHALIVFVLIAFLLVLIRVILATRRRITINYIDQRNIDENKTNRIVNLALYAIIIITIVSYYLAFATLSKRGFHSFYNYKHISLDSSLIEKRYTNQFNNNYVSRSGLQKFHVIGWKAGFENELQGVFYDNKYLFSYDKDAIYAISPDNGAIIWQHEVDRFVEKSLIIGEDLIFFNDIFTVYALRKEDGYLLWRSTFREGIIRGSAFLGNNKVFIKDLTGKLKALDAISGKTLWSIPFNHTSSSHPTIADGILYFVGGESYLYAVDTYDGKQAWKVKLEQTVSIEQKKTKESIIHGIVVIFHDETLFVIQHDLITQIDAKDGKQLWKFALDSYDFMSCAVAHDKIFINCIASNELSYDSAIIAIDLLTKSEIWKLNFSECLQKDIVLASDILYICSKEFFYGIDIKSGKPLWDLKLPSRQDIRAPFKEVSAQEKRGFHPFAIGNGAIYIGNVEGKYLCALK